MSGSIFQQYDRQENAPRVRSYLFTIVIITSYNLLLNITAVLAALKPQNSCGVGDLTLHFMAGTRGFADGYREAIMFNMPRGSTYSADGQQLAVAGGWKMMMMIRCLYSLYFRA